MKKIIAAIALAIFTLNLANAAGEETLKLDTLNGKQLEITGTIKGLDIDKYKGKVVFLEFWGHNCPPCLASIPHYIKLQEKYKDKLAIVAVEVQNMQKDALKKFVADKKINYDVVAMQDGNALASYIMQRAQWKGSIPFLVILDQDGAVQLMQAGMLQESILEEMITDLTKSKSVENNSSKKENTTAVSKSKK